MFNFSEVEDMAQERKPELKSSDFSFSEAGKQPDLSKIGVQNIFSRDGRNSNAARKLNLINKSLIEKMVENDAAKFGDTMSKSIARGIFDIAAGIGTLAEFYGDNMILQNSSFGLDDKTIHRLNTFGRGWQKAGQSIRKGADFVLNSKGLQFDKDIFEGTIVDNPSVTRVSAAIMSAIPSVLAMKSTAAATGSTGLAYFTMGAVDSADVYTSAKEVGKTQDEANLLYTTSMAGTALIDRLLSPLEKVLGGKPTTIWKQLSKRITAGLSEGTAEASQTVWQNAVKKYGIDDTQSLADGVIEAAIGGFGSASAMAGTFGEASERLKAKGATEQEINAIADVMGEYIQKHPDELNDIAFQQLEKGLSEFDKFVETHKGMPEVQKALQTKTELEQIHGEVSAILKEKGVAPNVAEADAKIWQGIALFGSQETGLSPMEYINQRMPQIENMNYGQFQNREKIQEKAPNDYNSEAFKRWFGDSKVVDEQGRPLKMVHFSGDEFSRFDKERAGMNNEESAIGFWFADREDFAFNNEAHPVKYDVYLKMDNPLIIEGNGTETNPWSDTDIDNLEPYTKFQKMFYDLMYQDPQMWDERVSESFYGGYEKQKIKLSFGNFSDVKKREVIKGITDKLKAQGYDGIIIKNTRFDSLNSDEGINQYVVFEPNQIKSVYNRGTFDPSNDDIRYQGRIAENGRNVELTINSREEMQGLSDEDFKNKMLDTLKSFKGNKIFNQSLNGDIEIRTSSIKKYKSFFADKNKRLIVPYIPELLGKARFDKLEASYMPNKETNVKAYYKADLPINIDNDTYNVHLTVKEDNRGNLFWDAQVQEKSPSADPATNPGVKGLTSELSEDGLSISQTSENVNNVNQNEEMYRQDAVNPKGAYMQNLDRNGVIYLFEKSDASTFMHETAHFFFKELQEFGTERSKAMLRKVNEWTDLEFDQRFKTKAEGGGIVVVDKLGNIVYGDAKPFLNVKSAREYAKNELFARGFEQYLREGKAPNNYLKQAFRSFWNWLRHLYRTADELNVNINDNIRGIYGEIIGGKELDFYLSAPVDEVLQQHFDERKERKEIYDEEIRLAQLQPLKRGFWKNIVQERTDGAKGRNKWWSKAFVPISTRAKRVNIRLKNKLRAYDYGVGARLNQYYKQMKPFLDIWATFTENDAVAFDLALKNSYVEKQLEIVKKYNAYNEFVEIKNLLNNLFDQAVDVGIEIGYTADYFPRQVDDVEGFMQALYGSPFESQLRRALREADPDNVMTNEQKAEFLNKYLRGFNRRDLNRPLIGNTKDRQIDIVTAEMNKYYKPSMQALINYVEGMNASIESRKFWGFKYDDIEQSVGSLTADLVDNGFISPEQDAEVQEILKARFKAKGVSNKWLNLQKNAAYVYTMGGLNSAITQLDDLSVSLYKAGFWNTVNSILSPNKAGLSREELGLEKIGQEFAEASASSKAVSAVFKMTGLDKIDAFGKNTLINATFRKFQQMAGKKEAELRSYLEPIMEQETEQTIEDIKNGEISENVKLLMFNELADMQPIALSEMPEWYLTSGNGRVFYMLKTFMLKRWDIFRNECFDKMKNGETKAGIQNLFKLSILMMMCGASKDAIIDMLFGRGFDVSDTMVNNFLGLFGMTKYSLYKARDEGFSGFLSSAGIPPIFAPSSDLIGDVYKSLFGKKGKDLSDYEILKGLPLAGRFYYWWFGGGKTKQEKKKNKIRR